MGDPPVAKIPVHKTVILYVPCRGEVSGLRTEVEHWNINES